MNNSDNIKAPDSDRNFAFKTSIFSGDIIYILAGIKALCERYNRKAALYLWLHRKWEDSVAGQPHPYGVNEYALNMLKPLIEAQPYIALFKKWEGEPVAVDLDQVQTEKRTTMPHGAITTWHGQLWPDLQTDTSLPWLSVITKMYTAQGIRTIYTGKGSIEDVKKTGAEEKIIVNRTARWRNDMIHYYFLKEVKDQIVFAGLPEEHAAFCKEWDLDVPHLKVNDFFELAVAIESCRYFIGNQSLCFAIAEALKKPRLLEICPYAPNVIPSGKAGHYFLHQWSLEWFVKDKESPFNQ